MNFTIKPVHAHDVATLARLIRALADFEGLRDQLSLSEVDLAEALFGPQRIIEGAIAWEIETEGKPPAALGFAIFFHNYSTFLGRRGLYLEDLFVIPACRSHGIGKALLHYGAEIAVSRHCGRFEWSVLDWNVSAISFYQKMGANVMPQWRICRLTGDALVTAGRQGQVQRGDSAHDANWTAAVQRHDPN